VEAVSPELSKTASEPPLVETSYEALPSTKLEATNVETKVGSEFAIVTVGITSVDTPSQDADTGSS